MVFFWKILPPNVPLTGKFTNIKRIESDVYLYVYIFTYIDTYLVAKHGGSDCNKLCSKLGWCNYQLKPWKLVEASLPKHRVLKNQLTPPFVEDVRSPAPPYIEKLHLAVGDQKLHLIWCLIPPKINMSPKKIGVYFGYSFWFRDHHELEARFFGGTPLQDEFDLDFWQMTLGDGPLPGISRVITTVIHF